MAEFYRDLSRATAETSKPVRRHVLYGVVVFLVSVLALLGLSVAQYYLGTWGLVLTELALAGIACLACLIRKIDLREAFPVKAPRKGETLASLMLWLGAFLWVLAATQIQVILFPQTIAVGEAVSEAIGGAGNLLLNLVVAALLPGICEEMLFRGFFYRAFSTMRRPKYAVPVVGILFGVFHLSLYRLMPTALLGIMLTYLIYRTGNILFPMAIHALNNAVSVVAGALPTEELSEESVAAASQVTGEGVLIYLVFGIVGSILIYRAIRRFDRAEMGWPTRRVRPEDEIVM